MTYKAVGIIEATRSFMPKEEGDRLGLEGFGELPAPHGEQIVEPVNRLLGAYALNGHGVFTTQDWHPENTAHHDQWGRHGVANTPGAEIHPEIVLPPNWVRFIKGMEVLKPGEEDLSYSGYYAEAPALGLTLPEWLRKTNVTEVTLGGLVLDVCVGLTAIDIRTKMGLEVVVAIDATRSLTDDGERNMLDKFKALGIQTATTEELIGRFAEAA